VTKLLEQGIEAAREIPADRQDIAGELLLSLAASGPQNPLTAVQIKDLKLAIEAADLATRE
jgi:hypothetical protein